MIEETCPKCGSPRVAIETITADQAMFGREAIVPANWPVWDEPVNRKTCKECWHHWDACRGEGYWPDDIIGEES